MIEKAKKGDSAPEGVDKTATRILPKPEAPGGGKDLEEYQVSDPDSDTGSAGIETDSVFD